jgi:hypothetical protein
MELTGGADCGALGGDEKSERVEEEVACGGSVRVERLVRPLWVDGFILITCKPRFYEGGTFRCQIDNISVL